MIGRLPVKPNLAESRFSLPHGPARIAVHREKNQLANSTDVVLTYRFRTRGQKF